MTLVPVYVCGFCGGAAKWTHVGDTIYFHCQGRCEGFISGEGDLDAELDSRYLDSVRSVSALLELERPLWLGDLEQDEQYRRFLDAGQVQSAEAARGH